MNKNLREALMNSCIRLMHLTSETLALSNDHPSEIRRQLVITLGDYARQLAALQLDLVDHIHPQLHPEVVFETLLSEAKKSSPDTEIIALLSDYISKRDEFFL